MLTTHPEEAILIRIIVCRSLTHRNSKSIQDTNSTLGVALLVGFTLEFRPWDR